MKRFALTMTALAALVAASGMSRAADCDITIGLVMELTGPAGEYGQAGAKSVEMAFRDINDAGGIGDGCKLLTDTRDSQSQGNVAVDMATQLVQIKKVPGNYRRHHFLRINPNSDVGDWAGKSRASIAGLLFTDTHGPWP